MRRLASFLLVAFALPVLAAEAWRWKDDRGVVHYSDTPVPGAERVLLPSPPLQGTVAPPEAAPRPVPPTPFRYTECVVAAPGNDETFHAVNSVTAAVRTSPPLQPEHRLQVKYDGSVISGWPARAPNFVLENVYRGTHTLAVTVVDADGKVVCEGPAISFHVRQPSLLSPARPKAP